MPSTRPFALVRTKDQWLRAAHRGTSVDDQDAFVELAWVPESDAPGAKPPIGPGAGLAFDAWCRLYRSLPLEGRVDRTAWAARDPFAAAPEAPAEVPLLSDAVAEILGDFEQPKPAAGPLASPRGLAIDDEGRLFVGAWGSASVLVYDLPSHRLVRTVFLAQDGSPGPRPIDLASAGSTVYVLTETPAELLTLTAHGPASSVTLPAGLLGPSRVAISPAGRIALLDAAAGKVWLLGPDAPTTIDVPPNGTDLEFESEDVLVVARFPGEDFVRVPLGTEALARPGLKARGYDGLGIVRTPDGHIGFFTALGFRNAVPLRLRYLKEGSVTTFRLDSGDWQTVWGRIFLDACIPDGTEVRVRCVTADEPPEEATLARTLPANAAPGVTVLRPDLSPPMPPLSMTPAADDPDETLPVHRRESGRELPWAQPHAEDRFVTYEAPISAAAGRYLWVTLELRGNTRLTPKVKCLRAEHPSHDYLRRLPRAFSRDEGVASFLRRYLAIFEGFLGEVDARSAERATLLDPRAAPDEVLPWLASFLGLVLDERWTPVDKQRTLIAETAHLWRARGTVRGLTRLLEIYLGVAPILVERFRMRGGGVAILGMDEPGVAGTVLGSDFRIGGAVGSAGSPLSPTAIDDTFRAYAHRFSVVIPAVLDETQRLVVRDILEAHRPAHTLYDVCTAGAGIRVGLGLNVGLTSVLGPSSAFESLTLGDSVLGGTIVGSPVTATKLGVDRLDGHVRVG